MTIVIDPELVKVVSSSDGSEGQNIRLAVEVEHYANEHCEGDIDALQVVTESGIMEIDDVLPNAEAIRAKCRERVKIRRAAALANRVAAILERGKQSNLSPRELYHDEQSSSRMMATFWLDSTGKVSLPFEYSLAEHIYNQCS